MRVISGTARSLPLKTVKSDATRPTTDRIKETLFNMLNPYIPGCRFLDLFSGSGGIGIEALSRGASYACFVDSARESEQVINENLRFTHLSEKAEVMCCDAGSALSRLSVSIKEPFDIVFMDPPYDRNLEFEVLKQIRNLPIISEDTILIFEASKKTDISEIPELGYEILKQKLYKTNQHVWLRRTEG